MNKSSIRAFGIAIFFIGALLAVANRFDLQIGLAETATRDKEVVALQKKLDAAQKELETLKKQQPEKVIPEQQTQSTPTPDHNSSKDVEQEQAPENTKSMTLQIYSGITPYIVAQKLEDGGVIDNSVEMELLLANAKYARSLQIGSYDINSSMSLEEIANLITGKKR